MVTGIVNGQLLADIPQAGSCLNLGVKLAAGQIIFCAADLSDLSENNPAFFTIPSVVTEGKMVNFKLTSNVVVNNGGHVTPELLGRMGTTASIMWSQSFRMAVCAVNKDDTTMCLGLSRKPAVVGTGAASILGCLGAAPADNDDSNILLLTDSIVGWNGKRAITVGYLLATIDDSVGGIITIQPMQFYSGMGLLHQQVARDSFTMQMPPNQMGAGSGSYFYGANGPVWATQSIYYTALTNRLIYLVASFYSTCTNGSNTDDAKMCVPFYMRPVSSEIHAQIGGSYRQLKMENISSNRIELVDAVTGTPVKNNDFSDAGDYLYITMLAII